MKDILKIVFMACVVVVVYIYRDTISTFITDDIIYRGNNKILTYNEYYLDNDYLYVQNIDKSSVDNYQEILNMFYSIINSGDENYSFYCNYNNCLNDVKKITSDNEIIANINNFVHPFNSFSSINIDIANSGKITVKTKKVYTEKQVQAIKEYINAFMVTNINDSMSNYDKIKAFHDYIVNNTIYDENNNENSHTAYSLITTGRSICGGYSDIMSIYLFNLNIKNYRITSANHIWNFVNLDNVWYHIDMTWDDPVASDGNQYLLHNFFMISTNELLNLDNVEHNFDNKVYLEAN